MDTKTGIVHVRPEDMGDETWKKHIDANGLVPIPLNRKERRAAAAIGRRSAKVRNKKPGR